jgi:hypothetical protein
MTKTKTEKLTTVPKGRKIRWVFNKRTCGRCGGTGRYHVATGGGTSIRVCYGCGGAGKLMAPVTQKNRSLFLAWVAEVKPTHQQALDMLNSGRFGRAFTVSLQEV